MLLGCLKQQQQLIKISKTRYSLRWIFKPLLAQEFPSKKRRVERHPTPLIFFYLSSLTFSISNDIYSSGWVQNSTGNDTEEKKPEEPCERRIMCDSNDKIFMNNSIPQEETERETEELEKNHVQFECQSSWACNSHKKKDFLWKKKQSAQLQWTRDVVKQRVVKWRLEGLFVSCWCHCCFSSLFCLREGSVCWVVFPFWVDAAAERKFCSAKLHVIQRWLWKPRKEEYVHEDDCNKDLCNKGLQSKP